MRSRLISDGARAARLDRVRIAPAPETRVDLDSLPFGANGRDIHAPLKPITRPANALGEDLRELGRSAAASLAKMRAGLITVRPGANGRFDVDGAGPEFCPPPCSTQLVRGICPVCQRSINFRLGAPRQSGPKKAGKFLDEVFSDLAPA